jgi:hypothetical protein
MIGKTSSGILIVLFGTYVLYIRTSKFCLGGVGGVTTERVDQQKAWCFHYPKIGGGTMSTGFVNGDDDCVTETTFHSSNPSTNDLRRVNKSVTRIRLRRLSSIVLVAAGLGVVPTTTSVAAPSPQGPTLACQNSVCVINPYGTDSDSDGFSDADEQLAGTNPYDANSRPLIRDLVEIWMRGVDTGRAIPFREIVVLPETTPDGKAIGRNPSAELPGRKDMLEQLGISQAHQTDVENGKGVGVMVNLGAGPSGGKSDAPPVRTNGMNVNEISNLEGKTTKTKDGERTDWVDTKTGKNMGYDETKNNADGSKTYTSCSSDGTCSTVTDPPPPKVSYSDPDYSGDVFTPAPFGQVIVATPEQIAEFNLLRGTNTNVKDTGVAPDGSNPPKYVGGANGNPTIILVNPDDDSAALSKELTTGVPKGMNGGVNVNDGRPDGPTRPGCGSNPALPC